VGAVDALEQVADAVIERGDGALLGLAQVSLELGEGGLDRIEIGAVGRQVAQLGARLLDELADLVALVCGWIVHDHDVAGRQSREQALPHILDEDRAVHRAIDDEGCRKAVLAQGGDEGHGLPMAPRNPANHALAALGTTIEPRHVGRGSRLIDEDQLLRVERRLLGPPPHAPFRYVSPLLLGGMRDFF
jgi:hypothetical protein